MRAIEKLLRRLENASSSLWTQSPAVAVALGLACCFGQEFVVIRLMGFNSRVVEVFSSPHKRLGLASARISDRSARIVGTWLEDLARMEGSEYPLEYNCSTGPAGRDEVASLMSSVISLADATSRGEHCVQQITLTAMKSRLSALKAH